MVTIDKRVRVYRGHSYKKITSAKLRSAGRSSYLVCHIEQLGFAALRYIHHIAGEEAKNTTSVKFNPIRKASLTCEYP